MTSTIIDDTSLDQGYIWKFQRFQDLMQMKIKEILLVSSIYDLYLFEEDGRLYELIRNEYQDLELSQSPDIIRVSSTKEANAILHSKRQIDLVITTLHIEDSNPVRFAESVKKSFPDLPVVMLSFDSRELHNLIVRKDVSVFDKTFVWSGDYKLIIGIIKYLEDKYNVEHDTAAVGVQSIIVIEDNIRSYSSFLPAIYTELIRQSKRVISEGINLSHKFLRMRARPKILLCCNYEEARKYLKKYEEFVLGVISDVEFPRNGVPDSKAGIRFAKEVKKRYSDIPVLLQSSDSSNKELAHKIGCSFLEKGSASMNQDLADFMTNNFGFGDFVFKTPDGREIDRAENLIDFEEKLNEIPASSIKFHGERNHFSNWLKARTEFWLADKLRPQKVTEFESIEKIRDHLLYALKSYRKIIQKGVVEDFNHETFDPAYSFARVGGGSLGGKARGLSFLNFLINNYGIGDRFEGITIDVPPGVVIGTDVFDMFMEYNDLNNFVYECTDDTELKKRFLKAKFFPEEIRRALRDFLEIINEPLSVRSSSLLEDSQYHPFAGVYDTYMIPNNESNIIERLESLLNTIKIVFASTYYNASKEYFKMTSHRIEEEKMAVIVQKMVGAKYDNRFYPDISGVAKSYNFYPIHPQTTKDGIVSVALGLGKTIVEGGNTVKFSPRYPEHLIQFYSTESFLNNNQNTFFALDLDTKMEETKKNGIIQDEFTKPYSLKEAEADGTLDLLGSTYSYENDNIYDGISRPGIRMVTFAPILKYKMFPLPDIVDTLIQIGSKGMGTAVEIEFAVNMKGKNKEFGVLQMRPLVVNEDAENINIHTYPKNEIICKCDEVLGSGINSEITDIIYVDFEKFDRSKTREIASEVNQFNMKLNDDKLPYLLIGYGRWGTLDPWLGIPVIWSEISGAKAVIEADMKDLIVEPSQGSHFFQNLTSFSISYFTVKTGSKNSFIDWKWLDSQKVHDRTEFVKHIKLPNPVEIIINPHKKLGVILKPKEG
ncbi:MAG: PEP/pyruvate-binding domain-containing protein [Ignavibacteria bacterium]|nr:PEP/pyruvate-binding domain-containing protein [Ignavibacteria bacterium]